MITVSGFLYDPGPTEGDVVLEGISSGENLNLSVYALGFNWSYYLIKSEGWLYSPGPGDLRRSATTSLGIIVLLP